MQLKAQVINISGFFRDNHREAAYGLIFTDTDATVLPVDAFPVHVEDFRTCCQALIEPCMIIHYLHVPAPAVIKDMQRLTGLLASEIGCKRLEVPVVGLPHHGRPAWMAHPEQQPLTVFAPAFEHGTVAFIIEPLGVLRKAAGVFRHSESLLHHLVECVGRLSRSSFDAKGIVMHGVHEIRMPETVVRLHIVFA